MLNRLTRRGDLLFLIQLDAEIPRRDARGNDEGDLASWRVGEWRAEVD